MPWFVASCVCCFRRVRIKSQTRTAMIAAPQTPPTTPPAIAPVFESEFELELFEFDDDVGVEDEPSSVAVAGEFDVGAGVLVVTVFEQVSFVKNSYR